MKKNKNNSEDEFEFDSWMKLAQENPEIFEKKRQDLIDSVINSAPERMHQRLNGLQWTIDAKIQTSKNPMDGCIKIYQMMMDSVYEPEGLLDTLNMLSHENETKTQKIIRKKVDSNIFDLKN